GQDGAQQRARRPDAVRDGRAAVTLMHALPLPLAASGATSSMVMVIGLASLGLGVLLLLVLAVPRERTLTTEERVRQYANAATSGLPGAVPTAPMSVRPEDSPLESAKTAAAAMLKRNSGLENKIAQRLEGAGSRWRPAEWLLFHSGIFLLASVVGFLLG